MAVMATAAPWFWPLVFAVLGGVFGSFITCALYRVPRGLSLRYPPSRCPACGTRLGVPDLVPLLSWLVLRGKCRHCGEKVSAYYLFVEAICVAAGLLAIWLSGQQPQAFLLFATLLCGVFAAGLWVQARRVAWRTVSGGLLTLLFWALVRC